MSVEQTLLNAIRRVLYPLVRMALRNGVPSDAVTELVRQTYVDVAEAEFTLEGKRQTNARISVITGLNRKEVARLRGKDPLTREDEARWNRAATVLAAWLRDEDFLDRKGDPVDLPFDEASPSFVQLVRRYSGDMQPWAVADELLRVDAVEEVDGKLRMTARGYVPSSEAAGNFEIIGLDTAELLETMDHNVLAEPDDKLLQLKVLANNMPAEHVAQFNAHSRRLARAVLEDLARWLGERDLGKDRSGDDQRFALGLGVFQINRPVSRPDTTGNGPDSARPGRADAGEGDEYS